MNKIGAMPIRSFGEYTVHSCNDDVIRLNINVLIMNLLEWEWDKQEDDQVTFLFDSKCHGNNIDNRKVGKFCV